jgi:hypothetical protein
LSSISKPPKINGRTIQKCEASSKLTNSTLKCNYVEFGENLSIKFNGEIDSTIAEFWNDIDRTLVKKRKPQHIEVTQILKNNPSHQAFVSQA